MKNKKGKVDSFNIRCGECKYATKDPNEWHRFCILYNKIITLLSGCSKKEDLS